MTSTNQPVKGKYDTIGIRYRLVMLRRMKKEE